MAEIKPPDTDRWASVAYSDCLGRPCLNVHLVASRAGTGSGSRTTGYRFVCATRDYQGCPWPIPESDPEEAKRMRAAGWKARGRSHAEEEGGCRVR